MLMLIKGSMMDQANNMLQFCNNNRNLMIMSRVFIFVVYFSTMVVN